MKIIFITLLFSFPFLLFSQKTSDYYRIRLYSGKEISGNDLEVKKPIFDKNYFILNRTRFEADSVQFYNDLSFNYGNCRRPGSSDKSEFFACFYSGKLKLFAPLQGVMDNRIYWSKYFNRDKDALKKIEYELVRLEIGNNPQALLHLKRYKQRQYIGAALISAGIGLISLSLLPSNSPESSAALFMSGLAIETGGIAVYFRKRRSLVNAIVAYGK